MIQTYDGIIKDISIIICTRNNEIRLGQTLEAIGRCTTPPGLTWEIIVVDNNSSDNTSQRVKSHLERLPIHYLYEPDGGLSQARNRGIAAAKGQLIIFTDDDIIPVRDWLQVYWEAFLKNPGDHFFGGPVESEFEAGSPDPALLVHAPKSIRGLDFGTLPRSLSSTEFFISSNWACPAAAIKRSGGFDPRLGLNASNARLIIGEEKELMIRLEVSGLKKWYIPEAKVIHLVPGHKCTPEFIAKRMESSGYSDILIKDFTGYSIKQLFGYIAYHTGRGMYSGVKYLMNRTIGRKDYNSYLKWKRFLGIMRGIRQKNF